MYFPNQPTEEIIIDSPRWEVELSNGVKCYHDQAIPSSWQRLKEYCDENQLKIKHMIIGFRSNIIDLPSNKESYFFRMMERQYCFGETTQCFYIVGFVENGILKCHKYRVPEMILDDIEDRNPEEYLDSII